MWRRYTKKKIHTGKGKRLIAGHFGSSEKGLIKDGEFIFQTKQNGKYGDYHKDMNNNDLIRR